MKNLFVVKNPISYLNAREWRRLFASPGDQNILVCLYQNNNYYEKANRMKSLINMDCWDSVIWFSPYTYKSKKDFVSKEAGEQRSRLVSFMVRCFGRVFKKTLTVLDLLRTHRIGRSVGQCDNAIFVKGLVSEQMAATTEPQKKYLTDTSKKILQFEVKGGYFKKDRSLGKLGDLVTGILMTPPLEMKDVSIFSSYCDYLSVNHDLVGHDFSSIGDALKNKPRGEWWVLAGDPMCEYHKVLEFDYIQMIAEACKVSGLSSENMVYAANPGKEASRKLERLKDELGCVIDDGLLPLEVKLSFYSHKPAVVAGFWSTALTSLASMNIEGIDIMSFWHPQFDLFSYLRKWRCDTESKYRGRIHVLDVQAAPDIISFDRYTCVTGGLSTFDDLVLREEA